MSKMKLIFSVIVLAIQMSFAQFSTAQNKVTDGNFEDKTPFTDPIDIANQFQTFSPTKSMTYWTVTANTVDKHNKAHWSMGTPPGGFDHHIDLNPNGKMEQLITGLVVGNKYDFTFYTSVHRLFATGCGATTGTAVAKFSVGTMFATTLSLSGADSPWTKHSYSFTATAATANLVFEGISSCYGFGGVLVDEVSIVSSSPCDPKIRFAKANNDTSICVDATGVAIVDLTASGGTSYLWSPSTFFANPALASVRTSISTNTQFVVKVTNALGCIDFDTVNITVHPLPNVQATPHAVSICNGGQINLNAKGAISYVWSPNIGLNANNISNPILTVLSPNTKYLVKGTDAFGCQNTDSIEISITPGPTVKAIPKDSFGCIGTNLALSVSGAKTYKWFPPTGISNDTMAHPILTIVGSVNYIVTGKDANGCVGFDTVHIIGFPTPNVKATQDNSTGDCGTTNVQLHATGAINYTWAPSIYCENNRSADPKVIIPNTLVFTVVGTNEKGCSQSDTITVFYKGKTVVRIPNAFTPDNDQLNDKIRPIIICDFILSEFAIYNRWGQQMFISYDIKDAWDGKHNGVLCDMDVYYYYAKGKNNSGEDLVFKGDITLIR